MALEPRPWWKAGWLGAAGLSLLGMAGGDRACRSTRTQWLTKAAGRRRSTRPARLFMGRWPGACPWRQCRMGFQRHAQALRRRAENAPIGDRIFLDAQPIPWEIAAARQVLGDTLAYDRVRIHEGEGWPNWING